MKITESEFAELKGLINAARESLDKLDVALTATSDRKGADEPSPKVMNQAQSGFHVLLDAMTQANPGHGRAFSLAVIDRMSDIERHRLQDLQCPILSPDQVEILERRIEEGFDAFGKAESLATTTSHGRSVHRNCRGLKSAGGPKEVIRGIPKLQSDSRWNPAIKRVGTITYALQRDPTSFRTSNAQHQYTYPIQAIPRLGPHRSNLVDQEGFPKALTPQTGYVGTRRKPVDRGALREAVPYQ